MHRFFQFIIVFVFVSSLALALSNDASSRRAVESSSSKSFRGGDTSNSFVAPEPLFSGEAEKLKPLVGPYSGAVAIHYLGPRSQLGFVMDYWKNGIKTESVNGMSMTLMEKDRDEEGNYRFDGDFVYTFRERNASNGDSQNEIIYAIRNKDGYTSSVATVNKPANLTMWGELLLHQKEQLPTDTGIVVWGLQGTGQNQMSTYSSISDTLQRAQWAMAIRLVVK